MTVSRASSRRSGLLLAGLLVLGANAASAQIPDFDAKPTGFLTPRTGGMATDAWAGTSMAVAKQVTSDLPAAPRSRALRDLQFKVMVSQLTPPAADGSPPPGLFARKVERMAAMGEGESLNEMVRAAGAYKDPAIAATVVDAMMMAGEREGACAIVQKNELTQPFAERARIACLLTVGDNAGALAAVSAMRGSDKAFATLVSMSAGATPPTALPPGPIDGPAMAMIYFAHLSPPPAMLGTTEPPLLRALVGQRALPTATRIELAERGEALAVIETSRLSELYLQALGEGAPLPAPMRRRAQLVASARNAASSQEIMEAVRAVYGETRGSPLFPTIARASAAALISLQPRPEYADVAQEAIRGFLLLGNKQLTQAWTKLALRAAYNNARAMNALDRLMPLIEIAGIDNAQRLNPPDINRWYEVMRQDDRKLAALRGNLMLELLRATGNDVPPRSTDLPETPPADARLVMPSTATLNALQAAGAARHRAETALLVSDAVAETPLVELHPAAVGLIVRSLRAAGEDAAARLFAIEIAIAHGL